MHLVRSTHIGVKHAPELALFNVRRCYSRVSSFNFVSVLKGSGCKQFYAIVIHGIYSANYARNARKYQAVTIGISDCGKSRTARYRNYYVSNLVGYGDRS